ncbi:MAG: thiamine phosphate synthase [Pirellulales bacterium]
MFLEFTPAAQRALLAATTWTRARAIHHDALGVPEVLLGLLDEPECRAALLLGQLGIDLEAARERFSDLATVETPDLGRLERASAEWMACLQAAQQLLIEYPRPLALATEHLLLGISAAENEVAQWLRERGLQLDLLEAEVHRLSGHQPGPLPLVDDELPMPANGEATRHLAEPPGGDDQLAALRAVDAAANRASEGLRVVEDYLRFVLDDRHLTAECKAIRHALTHSLASLPTAERCAARDTLADVGTDVSLASEQARASIVEVALASLKRVQQALRSLEEFSKVIGGDAGPRLEQLRYRTYTLERAAVLTGDSLERLADCRLYVLADGCESAAAFQRLVESLVAAGVGAIQLRDKRLADRELVDRARMLVRLTRDTHTLAIVNDRPELAVLAGADGAHVGQEELSAKDARRILGPRGLVGVSTHSLEQARAAVFEGANYIGVGPTFPSVTKGFAEFPGLELVRSVAGEIRLPAFAIGGITLENLPQVLATGATRVAVSSAIAGAADPGAAAREFIDLLESG